MITRISPVIIRRRGKKVPTDLSSEGRTSFDKSAKADLPSIADSSSLQVFPEVSKEEPMSPYLRMKEDVERLRKKWNLNF